MSEPHRWYLLLFFLGNDNLLCQPASCSLWPYLKLGLRHVDRALMVRHHHCDKIAIDIAGRLDRHIRHHLVLAAAFSTGTAAPPNDPAGPRILDRHRAADVILFTGSSAKANDVAETATVIASEITRLRTKERENRTIFTSDIVGCCVRGLCPRPRP